jgi:hypothetical protein
VKAVILGIWKSQESGCAGLADVLSGIPSRGAGSPEGVAFCCGMPKIMNGRTGSQSMWTESAQDPECWYYTNAVYYGRL